MSKIITYEGNDECFVVTKKNEEKFAKEFFGENMGRKLEDFTRKVYKDGIVQIGLEIEIKLDPQ